MKVKKLTRTLAEEIEVQAVASPANVEAIEDDKKNKELVDKTMKEVEKTADEFAKNEQPDSHDTVVSEVQKLQLDESLCEGSNAEDDKAERAPVDKSPCEVPLNENTIEDQHEWFMTDDRTSELLDKCFAYLREAFGDERFQEIAIDYFDMNQEELKFYCDLDGEGYFESLKESDTKYAEDESLNEAVEESTFSKLYTDLVAIPYVDRFIRTKFSPDEKEVDLSILLDDYVDVDAVYDVLDEYSDKIVVDEDEDAIHIHMEASDIDRDTDLPYDLFDEIMTQLTLGGRMIPGKAGGKGYVTDYGAGYDEATQVANAEGDKGIVLRIFPGHEGDKKGSLSTFEPAKAIADKYKDLGVYYTERDEIESVSPHRTTKVLTIWIPKGAKAAGRDERMIKPKKEDKVNEAVVKTKDEFGTMTYDIGEFEPWGEAGDTWEKICDADKIDELGSLIDELYNGKISDEKLNDLLIFEKDWLLETLGIKNTDEEE